MINFPNKKSSYVNNNSTNKVSHSNRGMNFEVMINESIDYYKLHNKAIIHKKPVPIKVVKVDYPSRNKAKIIEAYYQIPSTTDYNGIYKGKYIDFEAKETTSKTLLSLEYIHSHQVEHLRSIFIHGGIGFLLIYFKFYDEVYLYNLEDFLYWWDNKGNVDSRKSIPYIDIKEKGILLKQGFLPRLNILGAIDEKYFK